MAVFKRGKWYHFEFVFRGKRIQESARTASKTVAVEAERSRRRELELASLGFRTESPSLRLRSVGEALAKYLKAYPVNHRAQSVAFARNRLAHIDRLLGSTLLSDLGESEVVRYMSTRQSEGVSGRTINAELGELSRAIGRSWRELWPKVRKLDERTDIGRALSCDEEAKLLSAVGRSTSRLLPTFVHIALLTAMRSGEVLNLTWSQIDLERRILTVGVAKTAAGTGRQIPMSQDLLRVLEEHRSWFETRFGRIHPTWFLFPYGKPTPQDPSRPTTTMKTAWGRARRLSGVRCRLHDLRHTAITKMAEAGVPEGTLMALVGHMSRAMLERYSHVRVEAKRRAVEAMSLNTFSAASPAKSPALQADSTDWADVSR